MLDINNLSVLHGKHVSQGVSLSDLTTFKVIELHVRYTYQGLHVVTELLLTNQQRSLH